MIFARRAESWAVRRSQQPTPIADACSKSWLSRGDLDRERLLEMDGRMRPARMKTLAVLALAMVATGPYLGWWPLLCTIPGAACFAAAAAAAGRVRRPEFALFAGWLAIELMIAGAVALNGDPRMPGLSWLALPVVTLSSRFSVRGVVVGVVASMTLILAVCFGVYAGGSLADPTLVIAPLALSACAALLSMPLMRSDMEHRSHAVLDQLTGLLNRKALASRVTELAQQSQLTGEPVGLIVADLDSFKAINDTHGHAAGDAVLRDVANLLRTQLRAFDLAYRVGGEEFVILLPGSDCYQAEILAERIRRAVCEARVGGLRATVSLGVDASARGERFDYETVFRKADAALYRAKQAGRDRVCAAQRPAATDALVGESLGLAA